LQLDTELGTIHCALLSHRTPRTVALIRGLAEGTIAFRDHRTGVERRGRYYDGLKFFRRIPGVMVQTGCPVGDGTGHPGFRIAAELHADDATLLREPGAMVMACYRPPENRPDPAPPPPGEVIGSQFAITLRASTHLAGQLPVVGRCSDLDVVRRLSRAKHDPILKHLRVTPGPKDG
jgi:peptidyl-prolyl cis-trans isomerase A (cyclophilin A)